MQITHATPLLRKKSFFSAAVGSFIEYYDYALFIIFLPILSPIFFPSTSAYQSLVKGYFLLFMAALIRPLGGILFGYLGDVFGRRVALLSSIYGIACATLLIALTPSYDTIGISATVLIIIAKAIQTFCFGGECHGAMIFAVEHAKNKNELFVSGILSSIMLSGSLVASLLGIILTSQHMPQWSFRIAFIVGAIIGIIGAAYRKNFSESPHFQGAKLRYQGSLVMIKRFPKELLAGIFIGGFQTVPCTTALTVINPVLMTSGYLTSQQLMILQTFFVFLLLIVIVSTAHLCNNKSSYKIMQTSCWMLIILSYPLLLAIDSKKIFWILISQTILVTINGIFFCPIGSYLKNIFPMQYRYRGSSLSGCIGMTLIGGVTPLIESYIYQKTGNFSMVSIWPLFIGIGTFLALRFVSKNEIKIAEDNSAESLQPG